MRNNFQSLALVILILFSLLITKGTRLENSIVRQPASFTESVAASSLALVEQNSPGAENNLSKNLTKNYGITNIFNYASSSSLSGNLLVNIPYGYLPKIQNAVSPLPVPDSQTSSSTKKLPEVVSKTKITLISDLDNENDLISYNSSKRWPLASISKLMTAVLAIEEIGKDKEVIVSEDALNVEGNHGKLEAGKLYKIEDLIKIMIITSSNHAAVALADFYVFGQKEFVKLMNKRAADLSMNQTVFFDPAGLSPLNQATANDIRKLIKYIDNNHPEILAYSQEKVFGDFNNINRFAGQSNFLGGKTGYLDEAKQNLVSLFLVNSRRILIIVLGAEDRFEQTQDLLNYLQQYER
jgi:D-alanyl-D-alanine carboxypeptidase